MKKNLFATLGTLILLTIFCAPSAFALGFGARADYSFNKDGSVFAAFEHDAFNTHFDDYRIRTGISYNF